MLLSDSLGRDRTDFEEPKFSLLRNTNFEIRTDIAVEPLRITTLSPEAGRNHSFSGRRGTFALGLSIGLRWRLNNPCRGMIGEGFVRDELSPIIRPLVTF